MEQLSEYVKKFQMAFMCWCEHRPLALFGVIDSLIAQIMIRDAQVRLQFVGIDPFCLVFDSTDDTAEAMDCCRRSQPKS